MIATRLLRAAEATLSPTKARFNPYKAQKPWPPDFSKLDPKYQFRLERRYRRRTKLKWTRPRWVKGVKLAQWGICGCTYFTFDGVWDASGAYVPPSCLCVWDSLYGLGNQ